MIAVALLVVTGTFQAWRGIGTLGALTGTTYGVLVLGKIAGLALLLVLGDQGRRWVAQLASASVPVGAPVAVGAGSQASTASGHITGDQKPAGTIGASTSGQLRRLRVSVAAELAVAAVVLAFTDGTGQHRPRDPGLRSALLRDHGPPAMRTAPRPRSSSTWTAPASVPPPFTCTRYTPAGAVLPFASADARLTRADNQLGPVRFTFAPTGPGHATATDVVVPGPGTWTLTVQVHTDATTDYAATTSFEVH